MKENSVRTLCVHGARDGNNGTGAVAVPVYQSATFAHSEQTASFPSYINPRGMRVCKCNRF